MGEWIDEEQLRRMRESADTQWKQDAGMTDSYEHNMVTVTASAAGYTVYTQPPPSPRQCLKCGTRWDGVGDPWLCCGQRTIELDAEPIPIPPLPTTKVQP